MSETTKKNVYETRAYLLKAKYGEISEGFKHCCDDRLLVWNMLNQLLGACKDMENIECHNAFINVAINTAINEKDSEMESIVTRFTGKIYRNSQWVTTPKFNVYRLQPGTQDMLVKTTCDGELAFRFAKQLVDLGSDFYVTIEKSDGSEERIMG